MSSRETPDSGNPAAVARHFARQETAFHLGFLPTEHPHPVTASLSSVAARDPARAAELILEVDADIPSVARRVVVSPAFGMLVTALQSAANGTARVCFSGCGSTGRLAIILESMWRHALRGTTAADGAMSIMTGGDRALIRAVEHFEDYQQFGARQVADLDIGSDDIFIGISEGGETSSVIGTVREAADRGARTFFLYNNPTPLLKQHITRSRSVIEDERVTCLDLFSGPMALSGSTRMQATTLELLVCGIAMEEALETSADTAGAPPYHWRLQRVDAFVRLLRSLREPAASAAIGSIAALETSVYRDGGLITYYAENYLLDVFSDTTERSPTFMIPPFRPVDDNTSPAAWAYARDAQRPNGEAWTAMLGRPVRGISWTADDYRAMDAPQDLIDTPPALDDHAIYAYEIGNESDTRRTQGPRPVAIRTGVHDPASDSTFDPDDRAPAGAVADGPDFSGFTEIYTLQIVPNGSSQTGETTRSTAGTITVPASLSSSPVNLYHHLAVKLVFNTFSTTSMAILGRIEGNWMVQLNPTNRKLIDRGTRIIAHLGSLDYEDACTLLHEEIFRQKREEASGRREQQSPVVSALRRLGVLA